MSRKALAAGVVLGMFLLASSVRAGEDREDIDETYDITPRVFKTLPFDLGVVHGIENATLTDEAKALLARNGFVVVGPSHGNMPSCYSHSHKETIFITVDCVLEVFISDFEDAWCRVEVAQARRFSQLLASLWDALAKRLPRIPDGKPRRAAERLLAIAAVGRSLDDWPWCPRDLPDCIDAGRFTSAYKADLEKALKGEGAGESRLWQRPMDWSVFKPVGPYAQREDLSRLYRSSQWWGAQGLRCAEPEELLCAAILAWVLHDCTKRQGSEAEQHDKERADPGGLLWQMNRLYGHFLGPRDDLGPAYFTFSDEDETYHYKTRNGWVEKWKAELPADFANPKLMEELERMAKSAPLPLVFDSQDTRDWFEESRRKGQGVRLLAPRLTPETLVMSAAVHPSVQDRLLPSGLDFIAGLGDQRAMSIAVAAEPAERRRALKERLATLREVYSRSRTSEWSLCFQDTLLRLYKALSRPLEGDNLPLAVRTEAYHDRQLACALATWAGMREMYSPRARILVRAGCICEPPPGFVEPNIEGWNALVELCIATREALKQADVKFPDNALSLARRLRHIAAKQIRGEPLTEREKDVFLFYDVELKNLLAKGQSRDEYEVDERGIDRRVSLAFARSIAPDAVRWAGKACCQMYIIIEYGGGLYLAKGGVFDYREFDMAPGVALTREEFRKLMDSGNAPPAPRWTASYRVEAGTPPATISPPP